MKNLIYTTILFLSMLSFVSCQDELSDELFYKYSYLTLNGWNECQVEIREDNTAELLIDFGVNGTSSNDKDIAITVINDPDTLAAYNFDKFKLETSSYYTELPTDCYAFDQESYTIPKGRLKATGRVLIDMNRIDRTYNSYVLPLKIASSTGEPIGPNKYSKLLACIVPTNKYSGTFSGSGKLIIEATGQSTNTNSAKLFASSVNSCYIYAGNVNQDSEPLYKQYAINVIFNDNEKITLEAQDAGLLNFQPITATLTRKYTKHNTDIRYYIQTSVLTLKYKYKNLSPGDNRMLIYEGTHTQTKNVKISDYPNVKVEEQ